MGFETALRGRLIGDATVGALVGKEGAIPSIDWTVRRQGAPFPAIVLSLVSDPRPQTHDGPDSIRDSRVQVDVVADDRAGVVALREAVIAALLPAGTFFGVQFDRAFVDGVRDRGSQDETRFVHRDSIDFIIWHKG